MSFKCLGFFYNIAKSNIYNPTKVYSNRTLAANYFRKKAPS